MFTWTGKEPSVSEAETPSLSRRRVAGVHVEPLQYDGDVVVDRTGRQDESLGDVRVGQPVRDKRKISTCRAVRQAGFCTTSALGPVRDALHVEVP
jgi:hypothetical protein